MANNLIQIGTQGIDGGVYFHEKDDSEILLESRSHLLIFKEGTKHRIVIRASTFVLSLDISKEAAEKLLMTQEERISKNLSAISTERKTDDE